MVRAERQHLRNCVVTACQLAELLIARSYFRRLHVQRVVEAVEVVEQSDRRQQFDDLAFVVVLAQLLPELVVDAIGIERRTLGQFEWRLFRRR